MSILVTGANGFVGSALCECLRKRGMSVRGATRTRGLNVDGDECIAVGDISAQTDWTPALKNVDQVVHLAARVHVMNEKSADPLAEFHRVNVGGTASLARQAAVAGVRRFVFLSSIKVNGELTTSSQRFAANDVPAPADAYGVSKHEAEQVLWKIVAETDMELVILRPPLVYGPGVSGNFMRLLQVLDRRWPLPLGAIQNQRSLIYVGNLVDAIRRSLRHPKAAGKTFLVSDGVDVSTPELVRGIAAALGRRPFLLPVPVSWMRRAGRVLGNQAAVDRLVGSLCVDIAPLREELGWTPPYTMQAALEATALWYRKSKAVA